MDWTALKLSVMLAVLTAAILLPVGIFLGRIFAWRAFRGKALVEAAFTLPLVLPPTVLGYYLLAGMGDASWLGQWVKSTFGTSLVFNFSGLLIASLVFNLPFAIAPMQRAFEAIPVNVRHAAACCGMSRWRTLWRIELPLAWPGILSAMVMTFAHTLGEFGVVLMIGGSIPGETQTIAVAIYDRVQAFDSEAAGRMSALLLLLSLAAIAVSYTATNRMSRRRA
ncbi:molybdate ABC transporter permease subunit [Lacisediminimonas sp.]|uniref:molybdate ABC transporter permease subunit n=1 Tax=Lacisediminimonas sp. TaxID=3060582 RepID=UPI002726B5FF|nr:molybdate ABC transporter permease subunit [Lacisediminimonas sp.]MDO8300362.1 molybdate ABC transporter permease subunit [Lacisediminimonas sp.]